MFGRKYNTEKIVSQLTTILLPSCADHVTNYINSVQPDDLERRRMMFSMYLLPIAATHGAASTTTNVKFRTALLKAHSLYIEGFRDRDLVVNLGEIIVWEVERDAISRGIRDQSGKSIDPGEFNFHEFRYGTLLSIASDIRNNAFLTDVSLGMSQGQGDPKLGLTSAFNSLGISFTRYVLKIDPNDPESSSSERDRFRRSAAHASALLGQVFFNASDTIKNLQPN